MGNTDVFTFLLYLVSSIKKNISNTALVNPGGWFK